jgi:putative ATP-binding cassette transporter
LTEGTKELQLHREKLRDFVAKEIEETTTVMAKHRFISAVYYAVADSWSGLFGFIVIGVLVFFYVHQQHAGPHSSIATGYVLAFLLLAPTLQSMTSALPALGQAALSLDKIESLRAELARPQEASAPVPGAIRLSDSWKKLSTSQIVHSYRHEDDGSMFTLGPADLEILRGELVFITGGNGSGKTTLIKLLAGLYEPARGEIRLDNVAITGANREEYRQLFSAVFSDFFLFERLLGFSGTEESAQEYLQRLRLEHKVSIKQGRFSTTQLSQGQRKRLALLVAYLEDRPVYIFDEWASDQDVFFRNVFYNEILPDLRQKEKTVLVISHDDRYYHLADRIIKLDYGQVVECRRSAERHRVAVEGRD